MGNCCGKVSSSSDALPASRPSGGKSNNNFQGQGRTLGGGGDHSKSKATSSTGPARAGLPSSIAATNSVSGGQVVGSRAEAINDPKIAAAKAAEQRAQAGQTGVAKGKLGKALDAQKSRTQTETLADGARENLAAREADAAARARNWD